MMALVAVGALRFALPPALRVGPGWLLIMLVALLLLPAVLARKAENHRLNQALGYLINGIVTLDMVWSLGMLISALPTHKALAVELLRSAGVLWVTNILVFASWYWRLDGGGPRARELQGVHKDGAFLFPQMTLTDETKRLMGEENWSPGFVDYLFIAFNTNTAFSPTDCPVMSQWAKALMMVQAFISFATVALLAARAVNIL